MKNLIFLIVLLALSFSAFLQNEIIIHENHISNFNKEALTKSPLNPPTNLTGYMVGDDLVLFWDSPTGGSGNGEWIHWDTGENNGNGIGLAGGDYFYVASRWTPSELAPFDGMSVTQMSFFPNGDVGASYTLKIWIGENAGIEVMSQEVSSYTIDEFNIINLDNPVTIDASIEYWFGYKVFNNWGFFPAGCDDGPAIQEYGDMISMDGTNWVGMSGAFGLDYNWNIAIYIDYLKNTSPPQAISKPVLPVSGGTFMASETTTSKTQMFNPSSAKDLLGYNVHINGDSVVFTIEPTYTIENIGNGTHEFCVTAVYDEGESECSNEWIIYLWTNINENQISNIQIFPNPASDIINIKSDLKIHKVEVYNYSGQIIRNEKANSKFYQINTSQFEAGIYFLRIETEEGVVSERVVVQ